jgi:hypothetical protein
MFRLLSGLLLAAVLSGCSSGGGDNGGSKGGNSGSVNISANTLNFTADVRDITATVQTMTGGITNLDADVFLVVDFGYTNLFADWGYSVNGSQVTLFLYPLPPHYIGAGVHTGQIEVRACRDQNCSAQYSGSPKTVDVTYTVTSSGFVLSENEINLTHVFGSALPDTQEIIATPLGPWVWHGWSNYDYPRDPSWIDLVSSQSQNGDQVTYQFGLSKPLPVGEYSTIFGLFIDGPAIAQPVSLKVSVLEPPFLIDDNLIDFSYPQITDIATLQQTITVSEGSYGPRTWNVSTDADWLDISHDSGNTTDNNSFTVSANTGVQNLLSGQHQAWIILSDASRAYDDVRILVRLAKNSSLQPEPEIGCLEEAGVIFIDCESNEWNGFTAWEQRADGGMPSYTQPLPGVHLIDWSFVDVEGRGKVVDVQYHQFVDARAMLRVYGTGQARDLRHYTGGTVEFDVRVLDWGSTVDGLEFKLECIWPCESASFPLNISNLNQWYHFSFDVNQLQATGFDLSKADMGFQIFPAGEGGSMNGIHFQLDNIRWNR